MDSMKQPCCVAFAVLQPSQACCVKGLHNRGCASCFCCCVWQVQAWIDAALSAGGAVLVHCHEGKSRSVALLLAYLMISRGHSLATALAHIK